MEVEEDWGEVEEDWVEVEVEEDWVEEEEDWVKVEGEEDSVVVIQGCRNSGGIPLRSCIVVLSTAPLQSYYYVQKPFSSAWRGTGTSGVPIVDLTKSWISLFSCIHV